jgi:adenosylmethionine-8-amino-7-oxononanoate aminotransferase
MGRLGAMLASHLADGPGRVSTAALPDFAVLSKGLTAGVLPLSAVVTTDAVYALFDADYADGRAFLHSSTYAGNALGVAVANAVLDLFSTDDLLGRVAEASVHLRARLEAVAKTRACLGEVRACGMVAAVDLRAPDGGPLPPQRRTGYAVFREAVRRGALLRPLGDTMYLFPPLIATEAELDEMVAILADSVDAVLGGR